MYKRQCSAAREAKGLAASIRHLARDRRTWALGVVLVATLIAGIPLFCLVCPIGLTFGTVGSLWHLIVDKQVTLSAIVFPAALAIELVLYRKWCMKMCIRDSGKLAALAVGRAGPCLRALARSACDRRRAFAFRGATCYRQRPAQSSNSSTGNEIST